MTDKSDAPTLEEYRERLSSKSDMDLIEALNQEVGNPGWVSARGRYLVALNEVLHSRDFNLSAVDGLTAIPGRRKFRLDGKLLFYAD
jgi:hypothetical protein